ncbi:MAG: taurine dioxygenase [Alphaproteobacteria bacterium]|jgi:alpha-ketoglutarate-dependent taurine dioxygenase
MSIAVSEIEAKAAPETIEIKPLAMTIGAEILGADLSKPLPDQQVREIRAALLQWKAIFFRNQPLNHAQQVIFSRQFGECTPAHAVYGHQDDAFPEVYSIDRDRRDKRYKGEDLLVPWSGWHADVTPAHNPPAISILRGDAMPAYGGDTQFTDLVAAYNALSPDMQRIVDGLRGTHRYMGNAGVNTTGEYLNTINKNRIVSEHPLVRVHPETGARALYVSPSFLESITGFAPTESSALLAFLKTHAVRPDFTVRFKWENHSLAMWDNRSVLHLGPKDIVNSNLAREIHRTTLMGDIPVGPDGRQSTLIEGAAIKPAAIPK